MPPEAEAPSLASQLGRLAAALARPSFSTGDHAALRRMDPQRPDRATVPLQRLLDDCKVPLGDSTGQFHRWALIVHCLALARGRHDMTAPTGKTLDDLNVSEARLNQLLSADRDVLFDLLPRLARRLAAQNAAIDWRPLARIVLADDEDRADKARLEIARSYARAHDT